MTSEMTTEMATETSTESANRNGRRTRLEELRLRRRFALLEREAAIGRRVAMVLHDVAKPLAVIQIHARRLAMGTSPAANVRRLGGQLTVLSADALGALEGLLVSLRPEGQHPARSLVLRELLDQVQAAVRRLHPERRVAKTEFVPEVKIEQPVELVAALVNLVDNALQACVGNQIVRIEACVAGGSLRLDVVDSGPGMSESVRAREGEQELTTRY